MKRVSVVGAAGYVGAELCALLARHNGVKLVGVSSSSEGEEGDFASLHPALARREGPPVQRFQLETLLGNSPDCAFLAIPHETSAQLVPRLLAQGLTVIDLSGAYRLKDVSGYPQWYEFSHPCPELLPDAVYGLTEWCDGRLPGCRLVANPGCYATSILMALKPLTPFLEFQEPLICDSKSGISGAGKRKELSYSFTELSGNFRAYSAGRHRHEPEIRQELGLSTDTPLVFVPHLLPVIRGILSTLYVSFHKPVTVAMVSEAYHRAYVHSPFVQVHPAGELPELKAVVGTPRMEIGFVLLSGGRRAVIISVLDNLLKGAASQAVQNFNHVFGFDETEGLI